MRPGEFATPPEDDHQQNRTQGRCRDQTKGAGLRATLERHGFRTVRLVMTDTTDREGNGRFGFVVNNLPIFVHGTNWVPLDALHSRDPQRLAETVGMMADINCNMVRCWGGNVYESEEFFRLCDELGIETGVDVDKLIEVAKLAEDIVGHPLPGSVKTGGTLRKWRTAAA